MDTDALNIAQKRKEQLWFNPNYVSKDNWPVFPLTYKDIVEADDRLRRFSTYLSIKFPELTSSNGLIESELRNIPHMKNAVEKQIKQEISGNTYIKLDSDLPIAGSVKARGGIYEVLKHAEKLAFDHGILHPNDNYEILNSQKAKDFFSQYTVQVGSTGNLGLSIGTISAAIGFHAIVHMSSDAVQWKKDRLRSLGVEVKEYSGDYSEAVQQGRMASQSDPMSYFVDDENSKDLFVGYSTAALRLKNQLRSNNITVDSSHPLIVCIPCGVGGAPGGITFGLKQVFGDDVHCFFSEPVTCCSMLLGLASGRFEKVSVKDYCLSGKTIADGLAVARTSAFSSRIMNSLLSGIATINDDKLIDLMKCLWNTENIFIEPSSCACFSTLLNNKGVQRYLENASYKFDGNCTWICWATGGSLVPQSVKKEYLNL